MEPLNLSRWIKYAGRALGLFWAAFWIGAGVSSADGDWKAAIWRAALPGGLFLILVLCEWRFEVAGTWALFAAGLIALLYAARDYETRYTILLLAGPPVLGSALLAMYHHYTGAGAHAKT